MYVKVSFFWSEGNSILLNAVCHTAPSYHIVIYKCNLSDMDFNLYNSPSDFLKGCLKDKS